jgi:hypothetical protein
MPLCWLMVRQEVVKRTPWAEVTALVWTRRTNLMESSLVSYEIFIKESTIDAQILTSLLKSRTLR